MKDQCLHFAYHLIKLLSHIVKRLIWTYSEHKNLSKDFLTILKKYTFNKALEDQCKIYIFFFFIIDTSSLWVPYKGLYSTVFNAVVRKDPDAVQDLEVALKKNKPDLISLLKNPVSILLIVLKYFSGLLLNWTISYIKEYLYKAILYYCNSLNNTQLFLICK